MTNKAQGKYVSLVRETMKEKRPVQYRELSKAGQLEDFLQQESDLMLERFWSLYEKIYDRRKERGEEPDPDDILAMTRFKNQVKSQADEIIKANL